MTAPNEKPGAARTAHRLTKSEHVSGSNEQAGAASAVSRIDFQGAQLARIRAQARINDAKALAAERLRKGQHVDHDAVAFVIAQALASASPGRVYSGPLKVGARVEARAEYLANRDRRSWWFGGASHEQLQHHLEGVGLDASAELVDRALAAAGAFAVRQSSTRLASAAVAGRELQVTTVEHENLELRSLEPVDMPSSERRARERARRKAADKERKRKERREKNMRPREVYQATSLTSQRPWLGYGISRATFYRLKAAGNLPAALPAEKAAALAKAATMFEQFCDRNPKAAAWFKPAFSACMLRYVSAAASGDDFRQFIALDAADLMLRSAGAYAQDAGLDREPFEVAAKVLAA